MDFDDAQVSHNNVVTQAWSLPTTWDFSDYVRSRLIPQGKRRAPSQWKRATVFRGRRKTGSRRKMEVKQGRRDSTLGLFSVVYTAELVQ